MEGINMCIIVFKPRRVPMPTLEVMENCFKANPNGAGFMYRDGGVVHISKGYMTLEALLEAINLVQEVVDLKKTDVVIHFRISTHGSSIPANTHPFPLSDNVGDLRALNLTCDRAIAHNGILHEYGGFSNAVSDLSDTMYFAKMLSHVNDKFVEPLLKVHADGGSRFVFMSGKGKTVSVGMNKPKGTGIWYSNTTYLKPVVTVYNYRNYGNNYAWMGGVTKQQDLQLDEAREEAWQDWMKVNRPDVIMPKKMGADLFDSVAEPRKVGESVERDLLEEEPSVGEKMVDKWKREQRALKESDADAYMGWM
jgi:hypothetical protein